MKKIKLIAGCIVGLLLVLVIANGVIGWSVRANAESSLKEAERLLRDQRFSRVKAALSWLVYYEPENIEAQFLLGQSYFASKDYSAAVPAFSRVPEDSPFFRFASFGIMKSHLQTARMDLAEAVLKQHLAHFPDDEQARVELQWLFFNQFRLRELKVFLEQYIPQAANPYPQLFHALNTEIKPPVAQESLELLTRIDQAAPGQPAIQLAIGYCYWKMGEIPLARQILEKAHQTRPDDLETGIIMLHFMIELNEWDRVETLIQHVNNKSPKDRQLFEQDDRWHWLISIFEHHQNKDDLAVSEINKALEIKPLDIKYLQQLGKLYQSQGKKEQATPIFEQIKKLSASRRELYKIVSSEKLNRADISTCDTVARHCEILGYSVQAEGWKRISHMLKMQQQRGSTL